MSSLLEWKCFRNLIILAIWYHIVKLIVAMVSETMTKLRLFQRFIEYCCSIGKPRYESRLDVDFIVYVLMSVRINLIWHQLTEFKPIDDNHELPRSLLLFLGTEPSRGINIQGSWLCHRVSWRTKLIYSFKIQTFRLLKNKYSCS